MTGNEGRGLWGVGKDGEKLGSGLGLTSSRPSKDKGAKLQFEKFKLISGLYVTFHKKEITNNLKC